MSVYMILLPFQKNSPRYNPLPVSLKVNRTVKVDKAALELLHTVALPISTLFSEAFPGVFNKLKAKLLLDLAEISPTFRKSV